MGRLIILLILIAAIVLLWKAFGPKTWKSPEPPQIKGPDDDEDFLWKLELEQYKKRKRDKEQE
ncbi:hypothetical protein ACQX2H_08010 [Corynebacterium diphtheriae]|uniref:hypothetical protein n=1 Tax=Corynebacterium diphtheriae TaxID=1717 RepID=UPI0002602436|nr:hypothetical protein [Corynebacterium diphtheriae]EIK56722.1 hypothetical protein W5M_01841 [Corynebacterium diphtheriae bv. intermedius str. NCTC 5011]OWM37839.1 hypothetical protein AZF05_04115 [Corynebacterium diphtheriae bv. intermedius]